MRLLKGFTLIEVVISLMISLMIVSILYFSYVSNVSATSVLSKRIKRFDEVLLFSWLFKEEIKRVVFSKEDSGTYFKLKRDNRFEKWQSIVQFTSFTPFGFNVKGLPFSYKEVAYFILKEKDDTMSIVRAERDYLGIPVDERGDWLLSPLIKNIDFFRVYAYSGRGFLKWTEEWSTKVKNKLPLGFKVVLEYSEKKKKKIRKKRYEFYITKL